jgi:hypothetical protein
VTPYEIACVMVGIGIGSLLTLSYQFIRDVNVAAQAKRLGSVQEARDADGYGPRAQRRVSGWRETAKAAPLRRAGS